MRLIPVLSTAPLVLAAALPAQNPREAVQVAPYSLDTATEIALASDGDHAVVVFQDRDYPSDMGIYATRSDGRGVQWSAPWKLDSGPANADRTAPDVALTGDLGVAAWLDGQQTMSDDHDVWFSLTGDGGRSWSASQPFPKAGFSAGYPNEVTAFEALATEGRLYLGQLIRQVDRSSQLWVMASDDGGATWSPGVRLNLNHSVDVDGFAVAAEGPRVYAIWTPRAPGGMEIWLRRSDDGGLTWGPETMIKQPTSAGHNGAPPKLAVDGDQLAVAWHESTMSLTERVLVSVSEDRGATWVRQTSLDPGARPNYPTLSLGHGTLAVGWRQIPPAGSGGHTEARIATSTDLGRTWTHTTLATDSYPPSIAAGDGYLAAAWGRMPSWTIGMAVSRDGGATWLPPRFLVTPNGPLEAHTPSLVWNQRYRNFVCSWIGRDAGTFFQYLPYAGGLRGQTLNALGDHRPGGTLGFEVEHARDAEAGGGFVVLLSGGLGHASLPGHLRRDLGLADDALFRRSVGALPGPFSGDLDRNGRGATAMVTIPACVPSGTVLHAVAILGRACNNASLGSITDVTTITIQ